MISLDVPMLPLVLMLVSHGCRSHQEWCWRQVAVLPASVATDAAATRPSAAPSEPLLPPVTARDALDDLPVEVVPGVALVIVSTNEVTVS